MLDLRAESFGEMGRDLLPLLDPAYTYFVKKGASQTKEEFRALVESGAIWGLQRGTHGREWWYTSKAAIDTYWEKTHPVVPEPVQAAQPVTLEVLAALVREQNERLARIEARLEGLTTTGSDPEALRKAVESVLSGGLRVVLSPTS